MENCMNRKIPTEVHLYWATYEGGGGGYFVLSDSKSLSGVGKYHWLGSCQLDFGDVEFDEKALTLKSLTAELGEAQGKVNFIKERIQELLAIGHDGDGVHAASAPHAQDPDGFDDDIPF
jgi:hypothetical protein